MIKWSYNSYLRRKSYNLTLSIGGDSFGTPESRDETRHIGFPNHPAMRQLPGDAMTIGGDEFVGEIANRRRNHDDQRKQVPWCSQMSSQPDRRARFRVTPTIFDQYDRSRPAAQAALAKSRLADGRTRRGKANIMVRLVGQNELNGAIAEVAITVEQDK